MVDNFQDCKGVKWLVKKLRLTLIIDLVKFICLTSYKLKVDHE